MTMNSHLRQQQQQQQQSPDTSRHINFLWPSVDHVAYPRHNAGLKIPLAGAKYADAITFIDGHMLLKTAAVEQSVPPFKKCSQYEYRGGCERGSQCKYLHPVHIDASLTKRKRHRVLSSANTSQSTVGALDASLTLCETESDHKPVLQLPVLALPAPCVPRRTWWYRDPYSQTKVRLVSSYPVDASTHHHHPSSPS